MKTCRVAVLFLATSIVVGLLGCTSGGDGNVTAPGTRAVAFEDPGWAIGRIADAEEACYEAVATSQSEWNAIAPRLGLDPLDPPIDFANRTVLVVSRYCTWLYCPGGVVGLDDVVVTDAGGAWSLSAIEYHGCGALDCDALYSPGALVLLADGRPASVTFDVRLATADENQRKSGSPTPCQ